MLIEVTTRTRALGKVCGGMSEIVFQYQNCDVVALIVFRDEQYNWESQRLCLPLGQSVKITMVYTL